MADEKKVGFISMATENKAAMEIPEIGIGMIGYAFMGKAHTNGWKQMPYIFWPPAAIPRLVKICGTNESKVAEAAKRFGYLEYTTNWKDIINDERINIVDNGAPNYLHAEPCIEAAKAGKSVISEKPLGRTAKEAKEGCKAFMDDLIKKYGK